MRLDVFAACVVVALAKMWGDVLGVSSPVVQLSHSSETGDSGQHMTKSACTLAPNRNRPFQGHFFGPQKAVRLWTSQKVRRFV